MSLSRPVVGRGVDRCFTAHGSHFCCHSQIFAQKQGAPSNGRRNVLVSAKVKAAAVESPSKTSIDSKPKPTTSATSSDKITPEEAADMYRDMKLGRDFEEMCVLVTPPSGSHGLSPELL